MKSKIKEINPRVSVAYTSLNGVVLSSTLVKNGIVRFDVYPLTLKKWKRALFLSFLNLPNISRIICLTNDTKEDLLPYYPNKTLEVIPNAALPDRRRIAAQETTVSSELEHRPYIVSSGRLVRTKGFEVALRAYAKAGVHHQCDYVILGQGSLRERLVDLIEELGLQGHVHLLGYQSEPFPIVEKALCFVHASAREGFPNVLVEALSLGVPVIATNCKTGPSEIVQHGRNGFLTEMDDVEKISQYIHKIVSDPQLRLELSQYAPSSVDRFAEEKVFAQWENVLSKYDDK
jgi:glycosyltransferase involved in cell wall biosynthesis